MDNKPMGGPPMISGKSKGTGNAIYQEWLGTPPEFDRIDVELEADVVVCGGGTSGVAATRAAVEEGASVILFEKTATLQFRSGDFGTVGSELAKNWGREGNDLKLEIQKHFMKETSYWARQRILKYWLDHCGEALDWYISAKPDLYILPHTTDPIPEGIDAWVQPARFPGPSADYDPGSDNYPSYRLQSSSGPPTARFSTPTCKKPWTRAMFRYSTRPLRRSS